MTKKNFQNFIRATNRTDPTILRNAIKNQFMLAIVGWILAFVIIILGAILAIFNYNNTVIVKDFSTFFSKIGGFQGSGGIFLILLGFLIIIVLIIKGNNIDISN